MVCFLKTLQYLCVLCIVLMPFIAQYFMLDDLFADRRLYELLNRIEGMPSVSEPEKFSFWVRLLLAPCYCTTRFSYYHIDM